MVGQRCHIKFMTWAQKNIDPRRMDLSRGEPEMRTHPQSPAAHRKAQAHQTAQPRMRAVGRYDQRSTVWFSVDEQTNRAALLYQRGVHLGSGVSCYSRHGSGSAEKNLIEVLSSLAATKYRQACYGWESSLGNSISHMVAHAAERDTSHRLRHPEAIQDRNPRGHQSFPASLLFREFAALEEFDAQATISQQNCKCGSRKAATGNQNISHGLLHI